MCAAIALIDAALGEQLAALLERPEIRAGYRAESALCPPHLRSALAVCRDETAIGALLGAERERLTSLLSDESDAGQVGLLAHVAGVRWALAGRGGPDP